MTKPERADRTNRDRLLAAVLDIFPVASPAAYGARSARYFSFVDAGSMNELRPLVVARLTRVLIDYRKIADEHLRRSGHSMQRWQALFDLAINAPGETLTSMSARIGIIGPRLVLLLDELEAEGFIVRLVDAKDRRSKHIGLTPAGEELVTELYAVMAGLRDNLFDGIGHSQLSLLLDAAETMRTNLANMVETLPKA